MAHSNSETSASSRVRQLNDLPLQAIGECVAYVMARDQRLSDNAALYEAQTRALELEQPLVVLFCLQPKTGHRAREHYDFMLAGLRELETALSSKNIGFGLLAGKPSTELPKAFKEIKPSAIVFDMSPLRGPLKLHRDIAKAAQKAAVFEVDAHNIVPVWAASNKEEAAARTIRRKIMNQLGNWLDQTMAIKKHPHTGQQKLQSIEANKANVKKILDEQTANGSDTSYFKPGETAARKALKNFIDNRLNGYATKRNDPALTGQSELNPYLHYGQLFSGTVVGAVEEAARKNSGLREDADAFIEEITVRKELSDNFCFYNSQYDKLAGAPQWAQKTLDKHKSDKRDFTYTRQQFEDVQTHDDAWNAAQMQLKQTGKIHGYMRMYWAKKVLEWSNTPQSALETLLYLNDFYHLDGGDPNGYVGVLWSIAGLHDRPWFERPVYGQIRYMNANGLKRKFKIDDYINTYLKADQRNDA